MIRTIGRTAIVGLIASLLSAAPVAGAAIAAPAAAGPVTEQSFHALISAGFTVVSTAFVPGAEQSDKHPVVLVTLEKGAQVSVCTFALGDWETMGTAAAMDDATRCDIRYY